MEDMWQVTLGIVLQWYMNLFLSIYTFFDFLDRCYFWSSFKPGDVFPEEFVFDWGFFFFLISGSREIGKETWNGSQSRQPAQDHLKCGGILDRDASSTNQNPESGKKHNAMKGIVMDIDWHSQ